MDCVMTVQGIEAQLDLSFGTSLNPTIGKLSLRAVFWYQKKRPRGVWFPSYRPNLKNPLFDLLDHHNYIIRMLSL